MPGGTARAFAGSASAIRTSDGATSGSRPKTLADVEASNARDSRRRGGRQRGAPGRGRRRAGGRASRTGSGGSVQRRSPARGAVPATPSERLSGSEQDAFRRIAEALAVGKAKSDHARAEATPRQGEAEPSPPTTPSPVAVDGRLLDRIPAGIAIIRDDEILFANRALLDLVGDPSFEAFVAAGGIDTVFPDRQTTWRSERPAYADSLMARRRDGVYVPVAVRLHTIQWGPASALMLTISPRRGQGGEAQAASRLAAAEARVGELEAILDTATDGVIVIDRAGTIGSMNRAAQALFGVEADDLVGRSLTELLAEESSKPALDYLDGLATNGVASVLNDGREVIGKVPQGGLIPLFMTMGRVGEVRQVLRGAARHHSLEARRGGADAQRGMPPRSPMPRSRISSPRSATRSARRSTPSSASPK